MRKILLIGIGAGNPDHLTVQAIEAMNRADLFFIPDKGEEKAALRDLRMAILDRFVRARDFRTVEMVVPRRRAEGDYRGNVDAWHEAIAARYETLLGELREGETGAFLVWGDPTLYDSTLRILDRLIARGAALDYEIIPGISAVQVLAARHRVALNRIGEPVLVTTGRRLGDALPEGADSVVVMLDGELAFRRLEGQGVGIWWGAYLGMDEEILVSGPLDEVAGKIAAVRAEARERHGWIMDTYLLRRLRPED